MRRAAVFFLLMLVACSTPPILLSPLHEQGRSRTYALEVVATTTVDLGAGPQRERTVMRARSQVEVLSVGDEGTTIRMTLTPTGFEREGQQAAPPGEQVAELLVAPDGEVLRITSVGGVPADIVGTDVQDLAPLLGSPLPQQRVRVGDTWEQDLQAPEGVPETAPGRQTGRLAGLRVVQGYDCAIVALATRRPLVRERVAGDQTLRLAGTETSATEIAFAFRDGFPVEIHTTSEGNFTLTSGSFTGGTVTIETVTDLVLMDGA